MTRRRRRGFSLGLAGMVFLLVLACVVFAGQQAGIPWKCVRLLDEDTKSELKGYEIFFAGLFSLPAEYKSASKTQKSELINEWIKALKEDNSEQSAQAAAYLGIVKAKQAARPLEQLIASGKGGGRPRWVATRSLGQIGDKASIPVLINLLDDSIKNTRIYARASLAEITGVYFGEDKEKWKTWLSKKPPQYCTAEECLNGDANSVSVPAKDKPANQSKGVLGFQLFDVNGRMVDSQDYSGVPVLIMFGSCWCGGCQQDAEPFRQLAEEYAGKRLLCIRTVAGDNELAAVDFRNHYRLPMVQLLDTSRAFEKKYNPDGWTFLMLCDRQGAIVYTVNSPRENDWKKLRTVIDTILEQPVEHHAMMRDGTIYMPATLKRSGESDADKACQRFASIACAPDGKIYVVFTAVVNGSSDVLMRWFDGTKWSQDIPIAATSAQEYDATVLADSQNRIWVCWTSNTGGGRYDIFLTSFTSPSQPGTPMAVTQSEDDAMHGRMVCDKDDGIWVTYYKWRKMGQYSRDKEVYLRRFANKEWSKEIQVSPTDVPEYEDHSDPSISICGNWVLVAWSWDFHPPVKGYSNFAELPTIFLRAVNRDMTLGKISSVSSKNIDLMPAVGVSGNQRIWCAWDSQSGNYKKQVCIANPTVGADVGQGKIQNMGDALKNVCTPIFVPKSDGGLTLLWSETKDGKQWVLRMANLDAAGNQWSESKTIESQNNPRFAAGAYDTQGRLWVAYSEQTDQGRKILAKKIAQ
jgi:thiol-disulfide isomerase/thioredoxin